MSGKFFQENSIVVSSLFDSITPFSSLKLKKVTFIVFVQVGCGAVGLDLLATVASFPKPDQKIRSTSFKVLLLLFNYIHHYFFFHQKYSQKILFLEFF